MLVEPHFESARKCEQDQRHDDHGQDGVRQQNREIDGANRALALELHGADIVVVDQIGNQKQRRSRERRNHAVTVRIPVFPFDENIANHQQDGADTIQNRVECR